MTTPRRTKIRHVNHVQGDQAVELVEQRLPPRWVARKVTPDYGLDLHVEAFSPAEPKSGDSHALGEHFYIQVKSIQTARIVTKSVGPSTLANSRQRSGTPAAEGSASLKSQSGSVGPPSKVAVVSVRLDTSELLTIESMGAAVPVLLCVVALDTETVYFVCLNDYIARVLLPRVPSYTEQSTHTIHLPVTNVLDESAENSAAYIWFLARRGKLYAAFNAFHLQLVEIEYAMARTALDVETMEDALGVDADLIAVLRTFLLGNLRLDIWKPSGPGYWAPLQYTFEAFRQLLADLPRYETPQSVDEVQMFLHHVTTVMTQAALLGRMFEDVVRDWNLPTALGLVTTRH